ncbi:MBOAT family O-acyltransferase [Legionella quateirensis]|uniref:Probable alginate O-acetylase n=1 Tax=Legionella quateirensis TaxID=45072 RepID=A0A378KY88_9GAMM|nr:MBOAT family O-acyltransferase [Legionella quateirensis]KTD44872.1 putative alginate O-acetyltransferase AlgI [Legionella quateirensis]STY19505.1 putative alginate O-acetyltransferase AlgI [Legionella quateirensis]
MNFVTFQFILFFLISFAIFISLKIQYRKYFLLVCSYVFYGTWSVPLIGVILASTSVDYYLGKKIYNSTSNKLRKWLLTLSIVINCTILIYFKYTNFLLDTTYTLGSLLGFELSMPRELHIILPLGVSFYTFEAISYICDIYRGEKPASSWLNYNFYIMYFPHLISGPIVRYKELYKQFEGTIALPEFSRINEGLSLILYGFIFKLVIADSVSVLADPIFNNYQNATHIDSWLASIAFTVQIYFDFLGYTHIARGVSLFFNIKLPLNFNHPYSAVNISDFWQRWHMSLSLWIRDYLYIPFGGSRGTLARTVNNLLITMFIAGLWHGASWNYALWGLYHGLLLAVYHIYKTNFKNNSNTLENKKRRFVSILFTYLCVVFGWVLFRTTTFDQAITLLHKMIDIPGIYHEFKLSHSLIEYKDSVLLIISLIALCFIGPFAKKMETEVLSTLQPLWIKKFSYIFGMLLVLVFMFSPAKPFIYFVF